MVVYGLTDSTNVADYEGVLSAVLGGETKIAITDAPAIEAVDEADHAPEHNQGDNNLTM